MIIRFFKSKYGASVIVKRNGQAVVYSACTVSELFNFLRGLSNEKNN